MPHSGGGGSHSGGSHDGGGGSGGSPRPAMSHRPYHGCRSYVYYYRNRPYVYYADRLYNPKSEAIMNIIKCTIFMIAFMIMIAGQLSVCKGKLPLTYIHSIYIEDGIGLIEDKQALIQYLEEFKEKSGVTVSVITEKPQLATIGESCELKSLNKYMELWDDESHWLIYYLGEEKDRSDDWEWNLMCGDDCVRVLPQSQEDVFTDEFHRRLVAYERFTFDEAIIQSLDALTVYTNTRLVFKGTYNTVDPVYIIFVLPILLPLTVTVSSIITLIHPSAKKRAQMEASEFKGEKQEYKCPYCDRIYIRNQTYSCPYCGGPAE